MNFYDSVLKKWWFIGIVLIIYIQATDDKFWALCLLAGSLTSAILFCGFFYWIMKIFRKNNDE